MSNSITQLDPESLLLLHLADELSPEQRIAADRLLAASPDLRLQLEALTSAQDLIHSTLADMDHSQPLPVDAQTLNRRTSRLIHQWHNRRVIEGIPTPAPVRHLSYPWWAYPLTAAAAVFLAFLTWYGHTNVNLLPSANSTPTMQSEPTPDTTDAPPAIASTGDPVADELENSFRHPARESISAAEHELYALSQTRDDADAQDINQ